MIASPAFRSASVIVGHAVEHLRQDRRRVHPSAGLRVRSGAAPARRRHLPWQRRASAAAPSSGGRFRAASICAICGGSLRRFESALIFTITGFLVARSFTRIHFSPASIERMVAAISLNDPETISSAVILVPSSLLSPSARTWSPVLISASVDGLASVNLIESRSVTADHGVRCRA